MQVFVRVKRIDLPVVRIKLLRVLATLVLDIANANMYSLLLALNGCHDAVETVLMLVNCRLS
jgi:hypothetical protein